MDILGIGPLEFFFIILIALIVLGPNDMVKAGRTLGRFLRKLVTSPTWTTVQQTSRELRNLPNRLIREAGLEEMKDLTEIKADLEEIRPKLATITDTPITEKANTSQEGLSAWTTPPSTPNEAQLTVSEVTPEDSSPSESNSKEEDSVNL